MSIIQLDSLYLDPRVIELWDSNEIYLVNELEKLLINKNELLKNKDPWEILLRIKDPLGFFIK